jgi:hypothetical protein
MKDLFSTRNLAVVGIILLAALSRIVPHSLGYHLNIAPIMALALFGGAYLPSKKTAYLIPMASMFISDIFLGFHPLMWAVYGAFALGVVIGQLMNGKVSATRVAASSLAGSISFFIITNFAHWLMFCPHTTQGFVQCYIDAIPFFRNSLFGDLAYSAVFFGAFELASKYLPQMQAEKN